MKKKNLTENLRSGFTLIELLVVVAIIGILASVVLSSLNTARAKGADAAIKANLANTRVQAEIVYDSNTPNSYANLCTSSVISNQTQAAANALGGTVVNNASAAGSATTVVCHLRTSDNGAWAISSGLRFTPENSWCVDSTGAAKLILSGFLQPNIYACPQ